MKRWCQALCSRRGRRWLEVTVGGEDEVVVGGAGGGVQNLVVEAVSGLGSVRKGGDDVSVAGGHGDSMVVLSDKDWLVGGRRGVRISNEAEKSEAVDADLSRCDRFGNFQFVGVNPNPRLRI
nr:hypothetical protein Iba_chr07dCG10440 [Ipomoea batatas]